MRSIEEIRILNARIPIAPAPEPEPTFADLYPLTREGGGLDESFEEDEAAIDAMLAAVDLYEASLDAEAPEECPPNPNHTMLGSCPFCGEAWMVTMPKAGLTAWTEGALIQDALPGLKDDEREMLISGLCLGCQAEMFEDGEC